MGWHDLSLYTVTTQARVLAQPVPTIGTMCANYGHKVCTLLVQPVPITGTRRDNAPNNCQQDMPSPESDEIREMLN